MKISVLGYVLLVITKSVILSIVAIESKSFIFFSCPTYLAQSPAVCWVTHSFKGNSYIDYHIVAIGIRVCM